MKRGIRIAELFRREKEFIDCEIIVQGWVSTRRDSNAGISLIEMNDGSCLRNLQIVAEHGNAGLAATLERLGGGLLRRSRSDRTAGNPPPSSPAGGAS